MIKKVLVMGGSYFIGKKIVDVLLKNEYEVFTLNRGTKAITNSELVSLHCNRNDSQQMKSTISKIKFNIVIDISGTNREQGEILLSCLDKTELEFFIFISSSAVYDVENIKIPFYENSLLGENKYWTSYGLNKIKLEKFYQVSFQNKKPKLFILRPPYVYGENNYVQRESFIFDHIYNYKPIIIPNYNTKLQFIYTTDLAYIIITLIKSNSINKTIFNVGNKKAISILEWIQLCEKVVGKKATIVEYDYKRGGKNERDFFPFFDYDNVLNVDEINKVYNKETNFLKGLEFSYDWYIENKDYIKFKPNISHNEEKILKELNY